MNRDPVEDGPSIAILAYRKFLLLPHGADRLKSQSIMSALRDYIAERQGRTPEDVQNAFEARWQP